MYFLRGDNYVVDNANEFMLDLLVKSEEKFVKKTTFESLKNVRNQGLEEILKQVFTTGKDMLHLKVHSNYIEMAH
jgi:hypothetical protein